MTELRPFDFALSPYKRRCVLLVLRNECLNRLDQFAFAGKTDTSQTLSGEDAEPDFNLIEPAGRSGREMKMDVRVCGQPFVAPLVCRVAIENDMNFAAWRHTGNHFIHEQLEVDALFTFCRPGLYDAGGDIEGCKQVDRALALVGAFHATDNFPAAGLNVEKATTGGALVISEYQLTLQPGFQNTELEDCILPGIYVAQISAKLGIAITEAALAKNEKKYAWSERVKNIVRANAKLWSKSLESDLKRLVANAASDAGLSALAPKKR